MRLLAEGLWQLGGFPPDIFNVYLAGDVVIDAGTRWAWPRIRRQLHHRTVRLVTLTHCHPDHQGVAALLCTHFGVPLACHEADVRATEGRCRMLPDNWVLRLAVPLWAGPPHPVGRVLREGDEVAGFRVVHTPGHTPGHIVLFRDADRVAVAGDLLNNFPTLTGGPVLTEPPLLFSADPAENRRSILRLAELRPSLVCFGHGAPLRDPRALQRLAATLA
jgi:glyoxylase-like metal-dependent hydrolase (beta-lactamase superfamily II)